MNKVWYMDTINEIDLLKKAETGDLLLFTSNNVMSSFTRAFTWSNYDHVAMLIRFEVDNNELHYIDCTSPDGVRLNSWSGVRKYVGNKKFYDKLVYRKVNFPRNNDMYENIEILLKEVDKLPYGLTVNKL